MPQTRECDYCGDDVEPGTGTMFVRTNGSVIHYCSAKCEKNADLGREPRDLEWTEEGRRAKGPAQEEAPAADEADAETSTEDESDEVEAEEA